jgi:predicted RecB family endonuclease
MKVTIFKTALLASVVGFAVVSCNNSPKEKEEDLNTAKTEVIDAKADLAQAKYDSIKDYITYKESITKKLVENEKVIAELKSKINSSDKATNDLYWQQLDKLEKRNAELKHKIEDYKQGPQQKWELFKVEFNKNIDDLGKSISNMAERNMKK